MQVSMYARIRDIQTSPHTADRKEKSIPKSSYLSSRDLCTEAAGFGTGIMPYIRVPSGVIVVEHANTPEC
jgi:hypothetical protein